MAIGSPATSTAKAGFPRATMPRSMTASASDVDQDHRLAAPWPRCRRPFNDSFPLARSSGWCILCNRWGQRARDAMFRAVQTVTILVLAVALTIGWWSVAGAADTPPVDQAKEPYGAAFKILFIAFVVALLLESGLAVLF